MITHDMILNLVDRLFHKYASDYRIDAKSDVNDFFDKLHDIENANEQIKQIIISLERGIVKREDLDPKLLDLLFNQKIL